MMEIKHYTLTILHDYLKNCLNSYVKCDYSNMFLEDKIS
jgi:hypothetical protein